MIPRPGMFEMLTRLRIGIWGREADGGALKSIPETKLPERVIDVRNFLTVEGKKIGKEDLRLVESANVPAGSYAALSYCWGNYRGFLTERSSYQKRCEGFAASELPPLFRDACLVTRLWNIPYLWIDALCIVQDDRADWERQAVQMADTFRNCAVRIAATSVKDPTCGFLPPDSIVPSVRLKQVESTDEARRYTHEGKCFATLPKRYEKDVDLGRLNARAWVLQERLLAPRTVHFCKGHVYFETERWGIVGEDMVSQFELRFTSVAKDGISRACLMQKRITDRSYDENDDTSDSWQRIAELYSSSYLTYSTDKLIALSGLVQDRQTCGKFPYLGSTYYFGAWDSTLHEDLLWVSAKAEKLTFLKDLGLPTWSWISYAGPVKFLKDKRSNRERSTMRTSPIREFELLQVTGDTQTTRLPLLQPVTLSVRLKLAKVPMLGRCHARQHAVSHEETRGSLVFRLWPGTYNRPIPLVTYGDCFSMQDTTGKVIGFVSLDTVEDPHALDLWCAQIATVHDETYRGQDPLSRLHYAVNVDHIASITTMGLGKEYKSTEDSFILTYCLVVSRHGSSCNEYQRHGIAEVQCEWMNAASVHTISLI